MEGGREGRTGGRTDGSHGSHDRASAVGAVASARAYDTVVRGVFVRETWYCIKNRDNMASFDEPLDGIESSFTRAADKPEWIALSLTLVEYPHGGYLCFSQSFVGRERKRMRVDRARDAYRRGSQGSWLIP